MKELINEVSLLKEYLTGKPSEKHLTVWNGIQILSLLEKTLHELQKTNEALDHHITVTKAY